MKKKLVITKENIEQHVDRIKATKAIRVLTKTLNNSESIAAFFNTLFFILQTPKVKQFKVTKHSGKTGKPLEGKYVVDKSSVDSHFYFSPDRINAIKLGADIMAYLVDNVPKSGVHLLHVVGGIMAIEYKQVVVWSDQHDTKYAIQLVATLVKSHSRFDEASNG